MDKLLYALFAALIAAEFFLKGESHGAGFLSIPGNHAILGILGSILVMKFAKGLGKFWLYRKEDYYG